MTSRAGPASLLLMLFASAAGAGPAADSTAFRASLPPAAHVSASPVFTRRDLLFAAGAVAATAAATTSDAWLREEAGEDRSSFDRHVASFAQAVGNLGTVAPALVLSYGAARLTGHPDGAASIFRIGAATVASGFLAAAGKELVGRARPPGNDPDNMRPFSGQESFPSGHTTLAFALAGAIDRETEARWVPWVVYPAAALVGWSRVHDGKHWTSDVVAGAALGAWTASKTESWMRRREASHGLGLGLAPTMSGPALAITLH